MIMKTFPLRYGLVAEIVTSDDDRSAPPSAPPPTAAGGASSGVFVSHVPSATREPTVKWLHTELGRRTADGTYRIVRQGDGWVLLDAEWKDLGVCRTIDEAQQLAERIAKRSTGNSPPVVGVSESR